MTLRTLTAAALLTVALLSFAQASQAGTWTCNTGLNGTQVYNVVMTGDESGHQIGATASISIAGVPGGQMSVFMETPQAGELTRVLIGANDPRSKCEVWIMDQETAPGTHKAFSKLSNFPIKQNLEGDCVFTP